jgi:hypothetical protein
MFRALLAHPQEGLHKRHLIYCVRVMSVGCSRIGVELRSIPVLNKLNKSASRLFHSFSILSDDRSEASYKTVPPHSVI